MLSLNEKDDEKQPADPMQAERSKKVSNVFKLDINNVFG